MRKYNLVKALEKKELYLCNSEDKISIFINTF